MRAHEGLRGRLLRRILEPRGATVLQMMGPQARQDLSLIADTARLATPLVQDAAMLTLLACVREAARLEGSMAEAGVFEGATARLICSAKGDRPLHLFDVFETLQGAAPSEDVSTESVRAHFGRTHGRQEAVERLLSQYPKVIFHPGLFPRTASGLEDERFTFVHLDLDLPEGIREGLDFFYPRMVAGGILIGDDYHAPAVRAEFDRYFAGRRQPVIELPWGQALVVVISG
jgi:O-methyltransferase